MTKKTAAPGEGAAVYIAKPRKDIPDDGTSVSRECECDDPVTLKQAQSVAEAAECLLDLGCLPIFDRRSLMAAWKQVPESRAVLTVLASRYHRAGVVPR